MILPGPAPEGLDETLHHATMALARPYLGRDHGGYASHVRVDADGVAGAVVPDLQLGAAVGAIQRDAEIVARLAVGRPSSLQIKRRAAGEPDKGRRQVLDLVGGTNDGLSAVVVVGAAATASGTEFGVGGAAHCLDPWLVHQEEGHVHHV